MQARIEPFLFDADGETLFGCYHEPATPARDCAVVLAGPMGHEYVQFHRVFRQLAIMLADAGFGALRFDWSGTGDSTGDHGVWSLERWERDLEAALRETASRSNAAKRVVVGLRLGGTLAVRAGAAADALVLWDPVVDGAAHVAEVRAGHASMMGYAHVRTKPEAGTPPEVLGFPFPDAYAAELAALDLRELASKPARRALVVESHDEAEQKSLVSALEGLGVSVDHREYANPHLWVWTEDFGKMHVPRKLLQAIVDWMSEEYA